MTQAEFSRRLAGWKKAYGEAPICKIAPDGSITLSAPPVEPKQVKAGEYGVK